MAAALTNFDQAIELKPGFAIAYFQRGYTEEKEGNSEAALSDYTRAINLKVDLAEAYGDRGMIEQSKDRMKDALADYKKAIEMEPGWMDIFDYRGEIEQGENNLSSALADYNRAIALKPDSPYAYGSRASIELDEGSLTQGEQDYETAINLNQNLGSQTAPGFCNAGNLRCARREYTNALSDFRTACKLSPSDDYAHFGVWYCSSLLGRSEGATRELKIYLDGRIDEKSDDWPMQIGSFLTGQTTEHDLVKAAKKHKIATDKGQLSEAYFYIAFDRLVAGDKVGAVAGFKKCLANRSQNFAEYDCAKAELEELENAN